MIELVNNEIGETVLFEPDENKIIYIPVGEWLVKETLTIPDGVVIATIEPEAR